MSGAPRPGVAIATHSLPPHHEHELGWTEGRQAHLPTQYKQGKCAEISKLLYSTQCNRCWAAHCVWIIMVCILSCGAECCNNLVRER